MVKNGWTSDLHGVLTGRQPRGQKTRESLLAAAAVLFSEKGMETGSVTDVAPRAEGLEVSAIGRPLRAKLDAVL